MKKFKVSWKEYHEVEVEAGTEEDALNFAFQHEPEETRKNQTIDYICQLDEGNYEQEVRDDYYDGCKGLGGAA